MSLPEGTRVIVVDNHTGHEFKTGDICIRTVGLYEEPDCIGFKLENDVLEIGIWYMCEDEYTLFPHDQTAKELYETYMKSKKEFFEYISNE